MMRQIESIKGILVIDKTKRGGQDVSSWRIYVPLNDPEKCTGCMICAMYCPEAAIIANEEGRPEIDTRFCKGCGVCANECPTKSMKMVREG